MADIIPSLFGLTPEAYGQQQQTGYLNRGVQLAQLDPAARGAAMTYAGAAGLGNAIGGLLGAQDPQLKLIAQRQQLSQQIDMTNPISVARGAQLASQMGDVQAASALAAQAQSMQKAMAETQKLGAEATKIGYENISKQGQVQQLMSQFGMDNTQATAVASNADLLKQYLTPKTQQGFDLLKSGKYTPESVLAWQTGGDLEIIDKTAKPPADWVAKARELGLPVAATFGAYSPTQVAAVNKAVFNDEIAKKAAGAAVTRVAVDVKQEEAFAQKRGTTQAEELSNATNLARGASQALSTLNNMRQLDASGQLFTGPLANSYVGATNLLASVGLLSPDQTKKLSSSEVYDKQAKDLVMQDLGGKLGAQISDSDRKYVEARIPQLTTSQKARTELLGKIEEIQRGKIDYYRKMNDYANKNNNLNGFDFSETYSPIKTPAPVNAGGWSIKPIQ
jgi:hypothetical protein